MYSKELIDQQNEFLVPFTVVGVIFLVVMLFMHLTNKPKFSLKKEPNYVLIFVILAVVALAVRIWIAYITPGCIADIWFWRAWSNNAFYEGLAELYNDQNRLDYPPLYMYILYFLGFIRSTILAWNILSPEFSVLLLMPPIITDIVLSAFVFCLARKTTGDRVAIFLGILMLFNPMLIADSALWGQVDVLVTILMALTIYFLYKGKLLWAATLFVIGVLTKPHALMIAPVVLFVFIRNIVVATDKKKAVLTLLAGLGIVAGLFFLVPLPFGIYKEPLWVVQLYTNTVNGYSEASLNAFNLFSALGYNLEETALHSFLGLSLDKWGTIFIAAVCAYALWLYIKNPEPRFLFAIAAFILMGVFAFAHAMHERYLFSAPVLMLLAYVLLRDKRLFICSMAMFTLSMLNICITLYYYMDYLPDMLIQGMALVALPIYAYTIYVVTTLALKPAPPEPQPAVTAA